MKLTNYTDYSLRVLIYLAVKDSNEKSTITEITNAYGISRNHLTKVIHQLGQMGVIHTTRGRGGGIVLAKLPEEINIGAIVRETEEDFHMVECFNREHNTCVLTPVCGLKRVLHKALQAYFSVLDQYTIADLIQEPELYRSLLNIK
ncbi:MAG TPA: Rrf2 family transcriptional regulator [Bacillota bacterium]|nr:Rrf2 family transcriptional regulator [Bacillota bacterium]